MSTADSPTKKRRANTTTDVNTTSNDGPCNYWRALDDAGTKGFVYDSVVRRLAGIVAKLQDEFPTLAPVVTGLKDGSFEVKAITHDEDGGPDWTVYVEEERKRLGMLEGSEPLTAFVCGWFFLENYIYRLIAREVRYFSTHVDPFAKDKAQALTAATEPFMGIQSDRKNDSFVSLVHVCLWGNKGDLSLSVGVVSAKDSNASKGELLLDDTETCWNALKSSSIREDTTIIIVLDNCGIELLSDLKLVSFLLDAGYRVELHCKAYPVFVSDAMAIDVTQHVEWLVSKGMCSNLQANPRFTCKAFEFYCSPRFFHEGMPDEITNAWSNAALVVVKGDANYHRLVRDCHRPVVNTPFETEIGMKHANVLAIRTLKSPVAVGLDEKVVSKVEAENKNWCVDGSCGVIQYYGGKR